MRQTLFLPLFFLVFFFLQETACRSTKENDDMIVCSAMTPLVLDGGQGVSAPYIGRIDDKLIVIGGCNFPHCPAADGGEKVFYPTIFQLCPLADKPSSWQCVGTWPVAVAYGVSMTVPQGIVCVGGTDGQKSLNNAWLLHLDNDNSYKIDSLPSLPVGIDNAGGAFYENALYIVGGQCDGVPLQKAFRLAWPDGTCWEELPAFPGEVRVQPVVIATPSGLYLMGGYAPPMEDRFGTLSSYGCVYDVTANSWRKTSSICFPDSSSCALVGAVGALSPTGTHLLFAGGVDEACFLSAINRSLYLQQARNAGDCERIAQLEAESAAYLRHPVEWYRFNDCLIAYELSTGTWSRWGKYPSLARAGAALSVWDNRWYVVNGESKPGIRACEVSMLEFSKR